jgi:hypothetical protein
MRTLLVSCTLVCTGVAGCGRPQTKAARVAPTIATISVQMKLADPNITADQVAAIIVRESGVIPIDYLTVFETRVMKEGLWDAVEDDSDRPVPKGRVLAQYWQAIRAMPRDRGGVKKIMEARDFFTGDIIDIWMDFSTSAEAMRREGLGTQPAQLIEAANDVMRKSGVKPPGNKPCREFCKRYRDLRVEGHMGHRQAVTELVTRRIFGLGLR